MHARNRALIKAAITSIENAYAESGDRLGLASHLEEALEMLYSLRNEDDDPEELDFD